MTKKKNRKNGFFILLYINIALEWTFFFLQKKKNEKRRE